MDDPVIEKEIQNLVDSNLGDAQRLKFILECIKNNKKIYDSDQNYLIDLLSKHSKEKDILERLNLNPKLVPESDSDKPPKPITKTPKLHFQEKWCFHCKKGVFPVRKLHMGGLVGLLFIGIVPGLIYYALTEKVCPNCCNHHWGIPS